MVWLNTKPAVAASRIGAMPGTAERSSRAWAVMSETRGGDSALSLRGHHDDVATGPPRCVRGASGASPGPTPGSAVPRSEERRVGKEGRHKCRSRWWTLHQQKKTTNVHQ